VQLTTRQRTCLEQIIRRQTSPQRLVRRAKMLLALATGANECHVRRQRHLNRGTGRVWRQRWLALAPKLAPLAADEGSDKTLCPMIVAALTEHPRPGTPATFTADQMVQIVAVACEDPADAGRPVSYWTPREVAAEVRKRGLVATISTRSVGRFLKSGRYTAPASGILAQRQAGCSRGGCCRGGGSRCGRPARASGRPARGRSG
jgi:putative transposase